MKLLNSYIFNHLLLILLISVILISGLKHWLDKLKNRKIQQ